MAPSGLCVIGPGAVGSVLACASRQLSRLLGRREGYVEVHGPGLGCTITVSHYSVGCIGVYSIIAVKAYQTPGAVEAARLAQSPVVVVVQNGFGGLEAVEAALEDRLVAGGIADFGATRSLWRVELRGPGALVVGCRSKPCSGELEGLRSLISPLIPVIIVDDIEPWRWLKAAVNAAVNVLTAAFGVPNGRILDERQLWTWALEIVGEVEEAARRRGVRLPIDPVRYLERVVGSTRDNKSSALQDLEACRPTEVPYIVSPVLEALGSEARGLLRALKLLRKSYKTRCGTDPLEALKEPARRRRWRSEI